MQKLTTLKNNNMDEDIINEIDFEDEVYQKWVKERKNEILRMCSEVRKQAEWNKLFPSIEHSEDYLRGNIF